jgi:SAM-dependent methyltransferase
VSEATGADLQRYVLRHYEFAAFERGSRVLDVGCGAGEQVKQLTMQGCIAVGADISDSAIVQCRDKRLPAFQASAEELPVRSASFDGVICKVVLPYTDEARTLIEINRVLRDGGIARICSHGVGYYLRYVLLSSDWRARIYALRTLINTCVYIVSRWRLPGCIGDTIYQSRRRLQQYYATLDLHVIEETPSPTFLGLPVFIYQTLMKSHRDAARASVGVVTVRLPTHPHGIQ